MSWDIYTAADLPDVDHKLKLKNLPPPPSWRSFRGAGPVEGPDAFALSVTQEEVERGANFVCPREVDASGSVIADLKEAVNAALYLRRPLLLTGKPGTGKSTAVYAVARELRMGPVLRWSITSRSTLRDGLYQYDALGRLNDRTPAHADDSETIGKYVELGPLGTALYPTSWPRALLID